jgi:hypothetical protein
MRVLVCGSRSWTNYQAVRARLRELPEDSTIIHGACSAGADELADRAASFLGLDRIAYPANWKRHGKKAGPIRNRRMLALWPDLVIAFWDRKSTGTLDVIEAAIKLGIPVDIVVEEDVSA